MKRMIFHRNMKENHMRKNQTAAILICVSLTILVASCTSLRSLVGGPDKEARDLINAAAADLAAVRKMDSELNPKMSRIPALFLSKNTAEVNSLLDEAHKLVEKEQELLTSAAGKLDRASKLKCSEKLNQYITLKKGAAEKRVEGYREAAKSISLLRDSINGDNAAKRKAQAASQQLDTEVRRIFDEATKLEREAAELARQNPGLIDQHP